MNFSNREIVLIYNPKTDLSKKTLAYAKSITNHINEIDIHNTQLTSTIWKEVVNKLGLRPKEMMDRSSRYYEDNVKGHEITMRGLLDVLNHNPDILLGPIAIKGDKAVICKTPTDVLKIH